MLHELSSSIPNANNKGGYKIFVKLRVGDPLEVTRIFIR